MAQISTPRRSCLTPVATRSAQPGSETPSRSARQLRRGLLSMQLGLLALGPSMRRLLDLVASALGLLCLLPVFLIVATAIKVTSRGPVFFAQERIGRGGRRFRMWKFRTMVQGADALKDQLQKLHAQASDGVRFKMVKDPRITKVGELLRKLSIDELPQLFNVLIGDMTLVGPRPPVHREVALYDSRALRRLEVKPGLTCLWQVRGRSNLSFVQQVELDIEYIDRVTPSEEIQILIATVPAVLTGRGAYSGFRASVGREGELPLSFAALPGQVPHQPRARARPRSRARARPS
jgi:lipopolysaccharide/colanic/teichoic acid biosynthesis glycosyltransferase